MTTELLQLKTKEELILLIHEMGHVIRSLDDDNVHVEYWTNDYDEVNNDRELELKMALMTDRFYRDGNH